MSDTRLPLTIVREYIVSPYSSKTEADIAWEALDRIEDVLRRLSEWDVLNLAPGSGDDGPYWQREIAKIIGERR